MQVLFAFRILRSLNAIQILKELGCPQGIDKMLWSVLITLMIMIGLPKTAASMKIAERYACLHNVLLLCGAILRKRSPSNRKQQSMPDRNPPL